ncbi:MAG: rubredoxin [Bacteroidota bacterium]
MQFTTIKINLTGGIVSPGTLGQILEIAKTAGIKQVSFGSRQQLFLSVKADNERGSGVIDLKNSLTDLQIDYEENFDTFPNIISSYCAEEVFPTGAWLSEGVYKDIFDLFDYKPTLKINISDSNQSFTPFFTGNLNFIASKIDNFWYLYIRFKQSNKIVRFPVLVYTLEIPKLCKVIESHIVGRVSMEESELFDPIFEEVDFISQAIADELVLPKFMLPYYEGFNRYGEKTWLGIYRRNEQFTVDFLQELCELCLETKIGQICTTPWKSLIIKGIENKYRNLWDLLLGKHGINVRHAANELNWQVEDDSHEGLSLKKTIIREFDEYDVRTFGLSFALQTKPKSEVFGSVVVKRRNTIGSLLPVYDIFHTTNFNPNTREYVLFERSINKSQVAEILQRLCKKYYANISKNLVIQTEKNEAPKIAPEKQRNVHQCKTCFSIYDERFGDSMQNIPAGISFNDLPKNYSCPICEEPKENFEMIISELSYSK